VCTLLLLLLLLLLCGMRAHDVCSCGTCLHDVLLLWTLLLIPEYCCMG